MNSTIVRYVLTLAEFDFTVEWIPVVRIIVDSFSRMMLVPSERTGEALSLLEIVFGKMLGERLKGPMAEVKSEVSFLIFELVAKVVLVEPCLVEFEDEGARSGLQQRFLGGVKSRLWRSHSMKQDACR